jgi:hypothetical protein
MQVYLPDDLYTQLKEAGMSASALLQDAVRREVHTRELNRLADEYLADMDAVYGPPTPEETAEAEEWGRRIEDQLRRAGREPPAGGAAPGSQPASAASGARRRAG